ncbi:MAG: CAP domain-containing protein [Rhodobacteraceae bacterium]|nr:CAP domain-containing protein [Paracoccaceae bacterium]
MSIEIGTDLEESVVDAINAERSAAGLDPVRMEVHLNASAQDHSDWMAETGELSHDGEDDSTVADRVEETGFPLTGSWRTTENIAYASLEGDVDAGEVERLHDGLMGSEGHRENILDPDVSYVGIGLSVGTISVGGADRDVVFLTENFAETGGEVLVQEENDAGETVLQPYQGGTPVGEPEIVEPSDPAEDDDEEDETEDSAASGGGCFVATAAYGDPSHPDVMALRRFRDERLLGHASGRAFVRVYYALGPKLARVVAHDRLSGRAARRLIAPLARRAGRRG